MRAIGGAATIAEKAAGWSAKGKRGQGRRVLPRRARGRCGVMLKGNCIHVLFEWVILITISGG